MTLKIIENHIVSTPGICGGKPRIDGRRITVQNIAIWHQEMGMSAEEIAREYDLTLGDVYAALAFYHDNRDAIDKRIAEDDAFVAELKRKAEPSLLQEKLKQLRQDE